MENYGKILRKFINFQNSMNARVLSCENEWRNSRDYQEVFNFKTINAFLVFANKEIDETSIDDYSVTIRQYKVETILALLEVFSGMYRILNLRGKLGIINALDESLLAKMRKCKGIEDIAKILSHESVAPIMLDAVNFSDLSIYDKVLQIKALDEEDLAFLRGIYPLFEGEYEAYNVEVDEAFMIRQMRKWKDIWKNNPEKCYDDAAKFLDQYTILNNSLYKSLVNKTGHATLNDTKGMLKKLINE